jgi:carboxypeptidase Q
MTNAFMMPNPKALAPLLFSTLCIFSSGALAQEIADPIGASPSDAQVLIELAKSDNQVDSHLIELTETFGPRLTGSTSLTKAGVWAKERFESYGLVASLEKWGTFPVGFDRGTDTGFLVAPERVELDFVTNAWSAGTAGASRGRVVLEPVEVENFDASLYEGAWVLRRPRKERPKTVVGKELDALLVEAGMLGELRNGGGNPVVGGGHRISWDNLPTLVSIRLVTTCYDDLTARLEAQEVVEVEFNLEHTFVEGPIDLYNVFADITGTEFPEEYVIVGGHLDSWGAAVGAQDNGTGCATTLEAARLLMKSGLKPRRTIRFMLWSGEEQGLLGSVAYASSHPEVCANTSAVLVHDGGGNYLSGIQGPAALIDDLHEVFGPLKELESEMPFVVRENKGLSTFGMSDHASFTQNGAPGFFWDQANVLDYNYVHHTLHDTVDQVNPEFQRHSALVVAVGALGIANLDTMLDRTDLIAERPQRRSNRRTMGVYLEENNINDVIEGSLAAKAGWLTGDVIISIDGVTVETQPEILAELQKGEPKKVITLLRGQEKIESTLEWPSIGKGRDDSPK